MPSARVPGLNEDLLNIKSSYFDKGDMFWIAVDDNDRVIGSIGFNSNQNTDSVTLHRLFVKYNLKHQGIGTSLLQTAEEYLRSINRKEIYVHLGDGEEWLESRSFYQKHGYEYYDKNKMKKRI